jgi:Rieske Fe-S protein
MSYDEQPDQLSIARRTVLKAAACAPLMLTFGFVASPLARFLKPTMHPGGFFQGSDRPESARTLEFSLYDFPTDWTYMAFDFELKAVVFGPEQEQIRTIPGIAIRIAENEIAAFSRICPREGCVLHIVDPARFNCGCNSNTGRCCACVPDVNNPVLVCPRDHSIFDLADGGRVFSGPAPRPPHQFSLVREGKSITVNAPEYWGIYS